MTRISSHPVSSSPGPRAGLAGLHAYGVGLEFYRGVLEHTRALHGHAVTQLRRAAESMVLNVAEAHPAVGADRARRFRVACDEASECGAALELLQIRGDLGGPELAQLRTLLDRERAMLWRLSRPRAR